MSEKVWIAQREWYDGSTDFLGGFSSMELASAICAEIEGTMLTFKQIKYGVETYDSEKLHNSFNYCVFETVIDEGYS